MFGIYQCTQNTRTNVRLIRLTFEINKFEGITLGKLRKMGKFYKKF